MARIFVLVHQGRRLAHQRHGLLDQLVQHIVDVDDLLRLGLLPVAGEHELAQLLVHHHDVGDVIVDGKYGRDRAAAVADIQGRGFQYLPARRPRQVAQMVLGLLVLMLQLLHDDPGCTVADLPAGHVPVFDVYDGVLRVAAGHIVDDHLALVAELRRDARGDLLQRF